MIKEKLDPQSIVDQVVQLAVDFMVSAIIKQVAARIIVLFNPAGAIVQALEAIYRVLKWIFQNAARIFTLVETVVNGIADILAGNTGGFAAAVEKAPGDAHRAGHLLHRRLPQPRRPAVDRRRQGQEHARVDPRPDREGADLAHREGQGAARGAGDRKKEDKKRRANSTGRSGRPSLGRQQHHATQIWIEQVERRLSPFGWRARKPMSPSNPTNTRPKPRICPTRKQKEVLDQDCRGARPAFGGSRQKQPRSSKASGGTASSRPTWRPRTTRSRAPSRSLFRHRRERSMRWV